MVGRIAAGGGGARVGEIDADLAVEPAGIGGQDDDPVGQENGFGDGVGHEESGPALAFADGEEFFVEAVAGHLIEGAEGFVEEKDLRREDEGAGDGDAHLLAAGELARVVVGARGEADEGEGGGDEFGAAGGRGGAEIERERDVGGDGEPGEQRGLLEDVGEFVGGGGAIGGGGSAGEEELAGGDGAEAGDEFQERGFAATAGADEGDEITGGGGETEIFENDGTGAVALFDRAKFDGGWSGGRGRSVSGVGGRHGNSRDTKIAGKPAWGGNRHTENDRKRGSKCHPIGDT